jgi:hypothetical protein
MDKTEWCAAFKAEMLRVAGPTFDDGSSIADYADDTAPLYWDEPDQRAEGPEQCARDDMDCWGE